MIGYWSDFAKDDPNGGGRLGWPRFTPAGLEYMLLDSPLSTTSNLGQLRLLGRDRLRIDNPVRVARRRRLGRRWRVSGRSGAARPQAIYNPRPTMRVMRM